MDFNDPYNDLYSTWQIRRITEGSTKEFYEPKKFYFSNKCCEDDDLPGEGPKYQLSLSTST